MTELATDSQIEERRHPSLYFADGDIVVSATSKERTYTEFYRVDKVFLARHSVIFKDMLSIGSAEGRSVDSTSEQQFYDGVPKVHLYDDAEDVAGFIGAFKLYNTATLPLMKNCSDTPRTVSGIMRLAVKYETDTIRSVILRHIVSEWPQTLEQWERRQNERNELVLLTDETPSFPDPALAIRFAMEFHCDEVLPAAFYELAIAQDTSMGSNTSITWDCLHASDLMTLVRGQKRLSEACAETIRRFEQYASEYCNCSPTLFHFVGGYTSTTCKASLANCVMDLMVAEPVLTDPLSLLRRVHETLRKDFVQFTCDEVYEEIRRGLNASADEIWRGLPYYFVLPGSIRKTWAAT